jgi:hypothetical protein
MEDHNDLIDEIAALDARVAALEQGSPLPPEQGGNMTDLRCDEIPFKRDSVWNIGIGSGAVWSTNNDADVQQLHTLHGVVTTDSYGQPLYFASGNDPLVTVVCSDTLYPVPPQHVHVPAHAKPDAGTDQHMSFYDGAQPGKLWSYWGCSIDTGSIQNGSTIRAGLGALWDAMGDGVDNVTTGTQYGYTNGIISTYDIQQGAIDHAVRFAVSGDSTKHVGQGQSWDLPPECYPNKRCDWYGYQSYTGQVPCGCTIGIPKGVDLNSLGLSQGGMMLAKALQDYGGIWRDQGGSRQLTFYSMPELAGNPLIAGMQSDMQKIVPHLQILRNQGAASKNGGGTYRANTFNLVLNT